jgi:transposase
MLAFPPVRWRRRRVPVEWMGLSDRGNLEARRRHGLTRERSLGLDARMAIRRADQNASLPEEAMTDKAIVGIDISKHWIDVAVAGARHVERLANTTLAIGAWLDGRSAPPAVVAFEPTGGYERPLLACLGARSTVPFRVHPNALVAFRKSRGIRAKTDRVDARLIADFAADADARGAVRPAIGGDPALRELAARRRQLVDSLHAERCRLDRAEAETVRQSLAAVIEALIGSLKTIEAAIDAAIAQDADSAQCAALLQSVKGVGPVTAATLLADLPELGRFSAKEIAALVGLAPQNRESGKTKARSRTGHGRPGVRKVLFNAARSAIRHNPVLKAFYQKLVGQNRRPGKVALIAVMRKILVILNAIARDRLPWNYLQATSNP